MSFHAFLSLAFIAYHTIEIQHINDIAILVPNSLKKFQLQGKARVGYANDSGFTEGYTKHGIFHGFVRKFDEKGRLIFIGTYKNGHVRVIDIVDT